MTRINLHVLQPTPPAVSLDDLLSGNISFGEEEQLTPAVDVVVLTDETVPSAPSVPKTHTPKEYISYSEITTWMECAFRHKLKYVDFVYLDGPSEHTEFGQVVHNAMETFLKTKVMPPATEACTAFDERLGKLPQPPLLQKKDWHDVFEPMFQELPGFLDTQFPGWEFVASEFELMEPIENETRKFKGFIDGVIRVPKKRVRNGTKATSQTHPGWEYWIIDFKTTSWGWAFDKKTDQKKTIQLALYKYFWSKKLNVPLKDVRCGFLLLKRTPSKNSPRCELVPVSVGDVTIERTLGVINKMLGSVKKGLFTKNRDACKYCKYHKTTWCP